MSRLYGMQLVVLGHNPDKIANIEAAAEGEWPFADWVIEDGEMEATGDEFLCGGESEEEFAERLSKAIWLANGSYCHVVVRATFLENLPFDTHELTEDDYVRLMRA